MIKLTGADGNKVLVNPIAIHIVASNVKDLATSVVCGPITVKVKETVDEISTMIHEHMQKHST